MIVIFTYFIPKNYYGITIYPFIFLKNKELKKDTVLINHEKIHLKQQLELLIIPFYLLYGAEWLIKLLKYKNRYLAYRNLSFEREAYENEHNLNYLKNRKLFNFLHYYKKPK